MHAIPKQLSTLHTNSKPKPKPLKSKHKNTLKAQTTQNNKTKPEKKKKEISTKIKNKNSSIAQTISSEAQLRSRSNIPNSIPKRGNSVIGEGQKQTTKHRRAITATPCGKKMNRIAIK